MPSLPVTPNPFVKWSFTCKTRADEKNTKRLARQHLRAYLKGYASALKIAGVGTFKYVFKDSLSPKQNSPKKFFYTAEVKRESVVVPNPDSTIDPPKVKAPNL